MSVKANRSSSTEARLLEEWAEILGTSTEELRTVLSSAGAAIDDLGIHRYIAASEILEALRRAKPAAKPLRSRRVRYTRSQGCRFCGRSDR